MSALPNVKLPHTTLPHRALLQLQSCLCPKRHTRAFALAYAHRAQSVTAAHRQAGHASSIRRRLSRPRQVRRSSTHVTSSQQSHTQHAGCRSAGPKGVSPRLRPAQAQVRTSGDFTSSSTASDVRALCSGTTILTQGDCRTEWPTALRREPSCSTSPGQLPARSLRELASS